MDSPSFTGWFRPRRGRWRPVVSAATQGACQCLLLAYVEPGVQFPEKLVLPAGESPVTRSRVVHRKEK